MTTCGGGFLVQERLSLADVVIWAALYALLAPESTASSGERDGGRGREREGGMEGERGKERMREGERERERERRRERGRERGREREREGRREICKTTCGGGTESEKVGRASASPFLCFKLYSYSN